MTIIALLAFAAVMFTGLGFIVKSNTSTLSVIFMKQRKRPDITDRIKFFDSLWCVTDATRDDAWKIALIGTILGFLIGITIKSMFGIILGAAGFAILPRIISKMRQSKRKNTVRKLLPRIIADISAITRTSTLLDGFKQVAQDYPAPARDVFGYIHKGMASGLSAYDSVNRAMKMYDLPELEKLADAVRIISELGGGEHVTEILSSAADQVKFQERFLNKAKIAISEIKNETILSNLIVIGFFLLFASDPNSEYRRAITHHPTIIIYGLGAMAVGWLFVKSGLDKFKSRCGI